MCKLLNNVQATEGDVQEHRQNSGTITLDKLKNGLTKHGT